jgi:hypothetical protein
MQKTGCFFCHSFAFKRNLNVMDNMIKMMENYSRQLEETVEVRKKQLEEEQKKTEMLLYRMLPKYALFTFFNCTFTVS